MAFRQYLVFNGENIPMPVSFVLRQDDVEADSSGVTEAGTVQRDIVRAGVVRMELRFCVSRIWQRRLSAFRNLASFTVEYPDPTGEGSAGATMFMEDFRSSLLADTAGGGIWDVSFVLREY